MEDVKTIQFLSGNLKYVPEKLLLEMLKVLYKDITKVKINRGVKFSEVTLYTTRPDKVEVYKVIEKINKGVYKLAGKIEDNKEQKAQEVTKDLGNLLTQFCTDAITIKASISVIQQSQEEANKKLDELYYEVFGEQDEEKVKQENNIDKLKDLKEKVKKSLTEQIEEAKLIASASKDEYENFSNQIENIQNYLASLSITGFDKESDYKPQKEGEKK